MNIAVFADMHGNCVGLDAVLTDIKGREVDSMICLGDAVQGGSQPKQVVERLKETSCPVILGNSDSFILTGVAGEGAVETVSPALLEVRDWTKEQLGEEGLAFLESLPLTHETLLEDGSSLQSFHGSPRSFNEVLLPEMKDDELGSAFETTSSTLLAGGHTHLQWFRRFGERTFFNPGSAGVAYNRYCDPETFYFYPIAQYAIVYSTQEQTHVEFCQVPFDVDALEVAAKKSGRPYSEAEAARYRPPS
ncbi:MAG: metallophosphoesterase family protein [Actinomycetota bacterium]